MGDYVFGYPVRDATDSELKFFKSAPDTAGYAAEDGYIVLNPISKLTKAQKVSVAQNEAARLWMRENNFDPKVKLTQEQIESFIGTPYEGNSTALRQTIISRIISGDPSAGNVTDEQKAHAEWIRSRLINR